MDQFQSSLKLFEIQYSIEVLLEFND